MQVTVDVDKLRTEIQDKYADVALTPEKGFHFHTGAYLPYTGSHIGFVANLYKAVWAIPGAAHQTTRSVIFKRAAENLYISSSQCRTDGIARVGLNCFAIKLKFNRLRAIYHFTRLWGESLWPAGGLKWFLHVTFPEDRRSIASGRPL